MKALFLRKNNRLSLEETPRPVLQNNDDVILKVTASSICGSDIHFWLGDLPQEPDFIIGHEFVGVVEETGTNIKKFKTGDRVAAAANPYCGICAHCKEGKVYACLVNGMFGRNRYSYDLPGAQAEYIRVPSADSCLVHIPDHVSDKAALLVGDVLSTGYFAIENGNLRPGSDIAIFGAGPVGLCALASAKLFSPARIFLVDIEDYRLDLGRGMGATHVINPKHERAVRTIKSITGGRGVDLAVDAVGLHTTISDCISCATEGGVVSLVGIGPAVLDDFPIGKLLYKNLTLKTGLVPLNNMDRLMKLIAANKLDVTPLITHEMKLDDILEGYRIFKEREDNCIKVMITSN